MDSAGVDFGKWVGAIDGLENLAKRKNIDQLKQASYLSDFDNLAKGVKPSKRRESVRGFEKIGIIG